MKPALLLALAAAPALAAVKSGHAELELIAGSGEYSPGIPLTLGIQLTLDDGWHTYWTNPGEGGMAPRITWTLPEGWVAGPVLFPVPKRFMTGDLPGYGYEESVVFPVFLTPGENSAGEATITAKVNWLSCNDDACVPGSGEVSIVLQPGEGDPEPEAGSLSDALAKIPAPIEGASLAVTAGGDHLILVATFPDDVDPSGAELFPATPGAVDHSQPIHLEKAGARWEAKVPRHEYAEGAPERFEAVLAGGSLDAPVLLEWQPAE